MHYIFEAWMMSIRLASHNNQFKFVCNDMIFSYFSCTEKNKNLMFQQSYYDVFTIFHSYLLTMFNILLEKYGQSLPDSYPSYF